MNTHQPLSIVRLLQETMVPLKWIAQRLQMGAWTYLNNRLYWERRASR